MVHAQDDSRVFRLDLRPLRTISLGAILADLAAAQAKAVRRRRATGSEVDREVADFFSWLQRLVEAEAVSRDEATRRPAPGLVVER